MKSIICLLCICFLSSCSYWEMYKTTEVILQNYPSDNPIESLCEDVLKSETGIDVDISFWDDDEDKGWIEDSKVDCSCESS